MEAQRVVGFELKWVILIIWETSEIWSEWSEALRSHDHNLLMSEVTDWLFSGLLEVVSDHWSYLWSISNKRRNDRSPSTLHLFMCLDLLCDLQLRTHELILSLQLEAEGWTSTCPPSDLRRRRWWRRSQQHRLLHQRCFPKRNKLRRDDRPSFLCSSFSARCWVRGQRGTMRIFFILK